MVWAVAVLPTALSIPLSKCLSLFQTGCITILAKTLIHKDIAKPQVLLLSLFLIFLPHLQVNEFENHDSITLLLQNLTISLFIKHLSLLQNNNKQGNLLVNSRKETPFQFHSSSLRIKHP